MGLFLDVPARAANRARMSLLTQEAIMQKILYPMLCALLGLTLARPAAPQ